MHAPSTLGSFLRAYTHGHAVQLAAVARRFLVNLAQRAPILDGADHMTYVDIDSLLRRVYGKQKQGARFGHTNSDAEVAETSYTAFTGTKHEITARLIVRPVKDKNHTDALFPVAPPRVFHQHHTGHCGR
jgi:hypothetical protein